MLIYQKKRKLLLPIFQRSHKLHQMYHIYKKGSTERVLESDEYETETAFQGITPWRESF